MLAIGDTAPDFEAPDSTGSVFRLSARRGRRVALYFFPKSFTAGCARETREFAAIAPTLGAQGVEIVGISVDPAETQQRFASECRAEFPIVSDDSKEVARRYGVLSILGVSKRVTFFLDEQGIVRDVVASILPGAHVARAREWSSR